MVPAFLALSLLTLGSVAPQQPLGTLPPILQPQLRDGQQFRYQMIFAIRDPQMSSRLDNSFSVVVTDQPGQPLRWIQHYMGGPRTGMDVAFSISPDGFLISQKTNAPSAEASFLYNRALFGDPPTNLAVGTKWQNWIKATNPLGPPFGFLNVEVTSVDASQGLVELRFVYKLNARIRYPEDHGDPTYSSHDVSDATGTATFNGGIMTSLVATTSNAHDMPNGRRMFFDSTVTMSLAQ